MNTNNLFRQRFRAYNGQSFMPTRYTAKQLAETSERLRYERHKKGLRQEDILEFEYRKGNETRVLKRVIPVLNNLR
jgi:hypothetical protein